MRTYLQKALVETPTLEYGNAAVQLTSDDDVTMTVEVNNRQGLTLALFTGPWEKRGEGWAVADPAGEVLVIPQQGCGCGGTSVNARAAAAQQ